jgi:hypothetical protein
MAELGTIRICNSRESSQNSNSGRYFEATSVEPSYFVVCEDVSKFNQLESLVI